MTRSMLKPLLLGGVLLLGACSKEDDTPIDDGDAVDGAPEVTNLSQGWSKETQDRAWFTSFGSRLVPYEWFLHLEQAGTHELLRSDAAMGRLGFLVQGPSTHNPDGLPVGFTRTEDDSGQAWVGLGCAACHTGEVAHGDQVIRIDGGAGLIDFTAFEEAVIEALSGTIADEEKFERFARAVLGPGQPSGDLKTRMVAIAEDLEGRHHLNRTPVPYGHGRLDAFGQIFNAAAVEFLGIPDNRHTPDAPVSYPFLWGAPHLDLVQWNGSAPNAGPGPLFQNATTAIAVYGHAEVAGHRALTGYPSTVDFRNLGHIQEWIYELKAPVWPESILGELDGERIERGKSVYAEHCERCHQLADRDDPKRKLKATLVKVDEIGTDPRMVNNFLNATAKTGPLAGKKVAVVAGDPLGETAPTIEVVMHVTMGVVLRHPVEAVKAALEGYHKVYKANLDQHPDYYKARPLHGIWATAPFLHNGSVPNLHELLLPAEQRSATFHVGSRQLDVKRVGFDTAAGEGTSLFDTSLPGNGNGGHGYGAGLTDQQRWDLIEYLKSI